MADTRDYVAGRTEELDALLTWVEGQEAVIDDTYFPMSAPVVDKAPSVKEVSS